MGSDSEKGEGENAEGSRDHKSQKDFECHVQGLGYSLECSLVFSWVRVVKVAVEQFQVGQKHGQICVMERSLGR